MKHYVLLPLSLSLIAALACNLPNPTAAPTALPPTVLPPATATPTSTAAPLPPSATPAPPSPTPVPPSPTPTGIVYPRPELGFTAVFPEGWLLKEAWPGAPASASERKGAEFASPDEVAVITILVQKALGQDAIYWMDGLESAPPPGYRRLSRQSTDFHGVAAERLESQHTSLDRGPQKSVSLICVREDLAYLIMFQVDESARDQFAPTFEQFLEDWQWSLELSVTPTVSPRLFGGGAGQIAFDSERDGNLEIYVMNADGSEQVRLTNNPAEDFGPAWSPDGRQIAFVSGREDDRDIYVMNDDGSAQTRLTHNPGEDFSPAWSPDGTRIACGCTSDPKSYTPLDIYVMNADGSGLTRLTDSPGDDYLPTWSPDGRQIAFVSQRDGQLYVMNADGSGQTQLTNSLGGNADPTWSPDGTRVAFDSERDGNREIYVMNADGSEQVRLTNNPADDKHPAWSPDGTRIVFASKRDGNLEIYVMNADGSEQVRLTNNPADDFGPAWQP